MLGKGTVGSNQSICTHEKVSIQVGRNVAGTPECFLLSNADNINGKLLHWKTVVLLPQRKFLIWKVLFASRSVYVEAVTAEAKIFVSLRPLLFIVTTKPLTQMKHSFAEQYMNHFSQKQ